MKINLKIGITFIFLIASFIASSIFFMAINIRKVLHEDHARDMVVFASSISEVIASPLLNKEILTVQEIISDVAKISEEIEYIYILDFDKKLFAYTFDKKYLEKIINKGEDIVGYESSQKKLMLDGNYIHEIKNSIIPGMDAEIHIGVNEILIEALVNNYINHIVMIGLLFILLGIILAFLLAKSISGPINKLKAGVKIIEKGNLDYQVDIKTKDEIGELGVAFNSMAGKLKKSRNKTEEKVKDRTAELEKINKFMIGRELKMIELKKKIKNK